MTENKNRATGTDALPTLTALIVNPSINIQNMSPGQRVVLGYQLEKGNGPFMQDYELARLTYCSAAAEGNPIAMNNLGWLYCNGYGVKQDIGKAENYFKQSADLGCTIAMVNLGNIAENSQNYEAAYGWYREAYILGDPVGHFNYTNMYHWGWYVDQDYSYAYRNFRELAEDGFVDAFFYVGLYLQKGYGVDKNEAGAFQWFERGEQAGDAYSTTELGRCYSLGLGVDKDEEKGLHYYLEGIDRGDALAYANAGYCYESGQGTAKDLKLARELYGKGAELGDENCIEALKRLNSAKPKEKLQADAYDESFLNRMKEIGGEQGRLVADFLMKAVRTMGVKTGYSNGTVFTSPIMNIAPRERPAGEYIRLEHRISKLVVEDRLSEKRVNKLFQDFGDKYGLWESKRLKIQSNCFYLELTALFDEKVLEDYLCLLREFAVRHVKPKVKVIGVKDLWQMYLTMKAEMFSGAANDDAAAESGQTNNDSREPDKENNKSDNAAAESGENANADGAIGDGAQQEKAVIIDHVDMDPNTAERVNFHNERIEAAVHEYCANPNDGTFLGVILALHQRLLEGAEVYTPLNSDPDYSDDPAQQICTIGLQNSEGHVYMPILTSGEKKKDNADWQIFATMQLKNVLKATHTYETDSVGIVINPYSKENVKIPAAYVNVLEKSTDDKSLGNS